MLALFANTRRLTISYCRVESYYARLNSHWHVTCIYPLLVSLGCVQWDNTTNRAFVQDMLSMFSELKLAIFISPTGLATSWNKRIFSK